MASLAAEATASQAAAGARGPVRRPGAWPWSARVPWFRAHAVLLNDPGRLLAAHCAHSALAAGWAAATLGFELLLLDPSDPVLGPAWRQGAFVLPLPARLGLGAPPSPCGLLPARSHSSGPRPPPALPGAALAHAAAAGALLLAGAWHWAFWDLLLFSAPARAPALHFARVLGAHLGLGGLLCASFGAPHLTPTGPWAADSLGAYGAPRPLRASFSPLSAALLRYGALAGHHAAAGGLLAAAGGWHAAAAPGPRLYAALAPGGPEAVLSSSISALFASAAAVAAAAWYGGPPAAAGLFGPARFSWDSSLYAQEPLLRSSLFSWSGATESVLLLDYAGAGPAKGGLFRAGPAVKGDGSVRAWAGHPAFFSVGLGGLLFAQGLLTPAPGAPLAVRRVPAFFETFPVLLADRAGAVRAVVPFRRAGSRYSLSVGSACARFAGGALDGTRLAQPPLVKGFARRAQLGEALAFERAAAAPADGLFRAGARGWFAYSHALPVLLLAQGHLWHAGRAAFKDTWTGAAGAAGRAAEYGAAERLRG